MIRQAIERNEVKSNGVSRKNIKPSEETVQRSMGESTQPTVRTVLPSVPFPDEMSVCAPAASLSGKRFPMIGRRVPLAMAA